MCWPNRSSKQKQQSLWCVTFNKAKQHEPHFGLSAIKKIKSSNNWQLFQTSVFIGLKYFLRIFPKGKSQEEWAMNLKILIKVRMNPAAVLNLTSLLLPAPKLPPTAANWSHINIPLTSFIFNRLHWSQVRDKVGKKKRERARDFKYLIN